MQLLPTEPEIKDRDDMSDIFNFDFDSDSADLKYLSVKTKERREEYKKRDKQLLAFTGLEIPFEDFNSVPEGYFRVKFGYLMDLFFHKGSSDNLFIFFNGSRTASIPEFKRWSYYTQVEGSILNIADPMYRIYDDLKIGWYYGNPEFDIRADLSTLIKKIIGILKPSNVILCGSSAGGSAAVHIAGMIGGCSVIIINPQLCLRLYGYADTFSKIVKADLRSSDPRNDVSVLISPKSPVRTLLISNIASVHDDVSQLSHLIRKNNLSVNYGLSRFGNLSIWTYDAPGKIPHNNQEFFPLFSLFVKIIKDEPVSDREMYWYFNEFWNDHYRLTEEMNKLKESVKTESSVFAGSSKSLGKRTAIIEKSQKPWNHITLLDGLKDNTIYRISLNADWQELSDVKFSVVLKESGKKDTLSRTILDSEKSDCIISIGKTSKKIELRLYLEPWNKTNSIDVPVEYEIEIIEDVKKMIIS